jgi:glucosamine-6-phosphate deaminase
LIGARADQNRTCVLGLATGNTPVGVYNELVRFHREQGLSFANVVTFNLDEYYPMQPHELQSYVRFMREHLFDLVDIPPENWHVPDGTISSEQVPAHCQRYEEQITAAGGLGIGRTGHIGFNEPGSSRESRTRLITLDRVTRIDAASDFFGQENVPRRALTMGVGTILDARRTFMLAFGEHKAGILAQAVEQPVNPSIAASFLQQHANSLVVADEAAAEGLTRYRAPWLLGPIRWDESLVRKAVIWLALDVSEARRTTSTFRSSATCRRPSRGGPVENRPMPGSPATASTCTTRSFPSASSSFHPIQTTTSFRWAAH